MLEPILWEWAFVEHSHEWWSQWVLETKTKQSLGKRLDIRPMGLTKLVHPWASLVTCIGIERGQCQLHTIVRKIIYTTQTKRVQTKVVFNVDYSMKWKNEFDCTNTCFNNPITALPFSKQLNIPLSMVNLLHSEFTKVLVSKNIRPSLFYYLGYEWTAEVSSVLNLSWMTVTKVSLISIMSAEQCQQPSIIIMLLSSYFSLNLK